MNPGLRTIKPKGLPYKQKNLEKDLVWQTQSSFRVVMYHNITTDNKCHIFKTLFTILRVPIKALF